MRTQGTLFYLPEQATPATPPAGFVVGPYAKSDGLLYAKDDAGVERQLGGTVGSVVSLVIEETHTYNVMGAFDTATVFPPFFAAELYGSLKLTRIRTKLTSGTATLKIRIAGVDEVTSISVTSAASTTDFADETVIADLDAVDIVCTASSSAVDLAATLFFERTVTGFVAMESAHAVGGGGEPAFQNNWTSQSGPVGFYKDATHVYLQGVTQNSGDPAANSVVFTLPVGYRPSAVRSLRTVTDALSNTLLQIGTDGTVTVVADVGASGSVYLDGLLFRL